MQERVFKQSEGKNLTSCKTSRAMKKLILRLMIFLIFFTAWTILEEVSAQPKTKTVVVAHGERQ